MHAAAILDVLQVAEPEEQHVSQHQDDEEGEDERDPDLESEAVRIGGEARGIEERRDGERDRHGEERESGAELRVAHRHGSRRRAREAPTRW